jgi:hypothetical protein
MTTDETRQAAIIAARIASLATEIENELTGKPRPLSLFAEFAAIPEQTAAEYIASNKSEARRLLNILTPYFA